MVLRNSRRLFIAAILLLVLVACLSLFYMLVIKENEPELDKSDNTRDEFVEFTAPVSDFERDEVDQILNSSLSNGEKYLELRQSASLKIATQNYEEAILYDEAAYNLGFEFTDEKQKDDLVYEMVIISRILEDPYRVSKYENTLGNDKLLDYDTPKNKPDEAP